MAADFGKIGRNFWMSGFEPPTSCTPCKRASQAALHPVEIVSYQIEAKPSNWNSARLNSATPKRAQDSMIFSSGSSAPTFAASRSTEIEAEKTTPARRPFTRKLAKMPPFFLEILTKRMRLLSLKVRVHESSCAKCSSHTDDRPKLKTPYTMPSIPLKAQTLHRVIRDVGNAVSPKAPQSGNLETPLGKVGNYSTFPLPWQLRIRPLTFGRVMPTMG